MRKIITISLPSQTARFVDTLVSEGGYASTSELFRELIRTRETHEKENRSFNTGAFLRAVKTHGKRGAPKKLSSQHDRCLYGT